MNDGATAANKVAAVTAAFWVMKICATTLGETAGDLLSMTMGIGYALSSVLLIGLFLVTLCAQLLASRFHPLLYWSVILTTSTAGTTISDYLDRSLGLGYAGGALILVTGLALMLTAWRLTEGTISVAHIHTRRAESFYWLVILLSNTLGTAFGDFLADDSGLGFVGGAALISAALAVLLALHRFAIGNRVILFWLAFVLTRPLGATLGDMLTKPIAAGGLNLGTIGASAVLAAVLLGLILLTSDRARRTDLAA